MAFYIKNVTCQLLCDIIFCKTLFWPHNLRTDGEIRDGLYVLQGWTCVSKSHVLEFRTSILEALYATTSWLVLLTFSFMCCTMWPISLSFTKWVWKDVQLFLLHRGTQGAFLVIFKLIAGLFCLFYFAGLGFQLEKWSASPSSGTPWDLIQENKCVVLTTKHFYLIPCQLCYLHICL